MATLLSLIQDVCDLGGLPRPSTVVGSTDATVRQLLAIAHERGAEAVRMFDWPQLTRARTLVLTASQTQTLPADFAELADSTAWYTADMSPLTGPITYQQWQSLTQTAASPIKFAFRVQLTSTAGRGLAFTPTPVGGENVAIFYRSKSWVRPRLWTASTAITATAVAPVYVYSDSQIWRTTTTGTTGANAPTTANSGNDGGIVWTAQNMAYERFLADTDEPLLESTVLTKGILSRFYRMKGFEYQDLEVDYFTGLKADLAEQNGGRTSNLYRGYGTFVSEANIKEGNW